MKLLNRSILLLLFFFYSTIFVMAEHLKFTQYYAIETNATDDEELIKVIKQIDGYLNNNVIEHTDEFSKKLTLTKFIKADGKTKNFNKLLIDTITRDEKGEYSAKVCVYDIKNGKRTKLEKPLSHLYKYDEIKKECFPLAVSEFKEDIIQKIVSYSNLFCVVDYEHKKWLKEQELKKKLKKK